MFLSLPRGQTVTGVQLYLTADLGVFANTVCIFLMSFKEVHRQKIEKEETEF